MSSWEGQLGYGAASALWRCASCFLCVPTSEIGSGVTIVYVPNRSYWLGWVPSASMHGLCSRYGSPVFCLCLQQSYSLRPEKALTIALSSSPRKCSEVAASARKAFCRASNGNDWVRSLNKAKGHWAYFMLCCVWEYSCHSVIPEGFGHIAVSDHAADRWVRGAHGAKLMRFSGVRRPSIA